MIEGGEEIAPKFPFKAVLKPMTFLHRTSKKFFSFSYLKFLNFLFSSVDSDGGKTPKGIDSALQSGKK